MTAHVGKPVSRVDGRAKVTGEAKYAAEHHAPDLAYGVVISSPVARGRMTRIDATAALAIPGVIQVITHENALKLARSDRSYRDESAPPGAPFRPLHDAEIRFSGQPVALVVAESFELASHAAALVQIDYLREPHATDLETERRAVHAPKKRSAIAPPPAPRGDADRALARAEARVDVEVRLPFEHHNPMEPFATTVIRDDDGKLTVHDKTQGVQNVQSYLCRVFDCSKDELRVLSPFVGGAFGSGLRPQYQVFLAVLAARQLERSIRVTLTRQQMFTLGHRPTTYQRVALGARRDGALTAVIHEAVAETSRYEDYSEDVVNWSGLLYKCDNVRLAHEVAPLDLCTPCDMRAPGAAWGVHALECAMDELASELGIDPVELRLRNYAERDANDDRPFSSKELRACYRVGAEKFGWSRRLPAPRSMREGESLVGWGMASAAWEAKQHKASAKALFTADCRLTVSSATADIGTGTYTIMTQIAAEMLGLPIDRVTFKLGDSALPRSPVEGGSWTASTVGSAVQAVCEALRKKLFKLARKVEGSPLAGARIDDVVFVDRAIRLIGDPSRSVSLLDALRGSGEDAVEAKASAEPAPNQKRYSRYSHSAVFAEVKVDCDLGIIRVARVVSAVAAGRILNPKTAESQIMGGIVWGLGMALEEASVIDQAYGRFINHSFAEYHVPVHADMPAIEVHFVEEHDAIVNPLGAKGLGEIGLVGVAAAIASAVFHATGRRVRDLPITLDKLL
jgi:xanthine dehydrogenase YagR molybdenum-binding subunit